MKNPSLRDQQRLNCTVFIHGAAALSRSWVIRSCAGALSHNLPVRTVSPKMTRIGVSPAAAWFGGGVGDPDVAYDASAQGFVLPEVMDCAIKP